MVGSFILLNNNLIPGCIIRHLNVIYGSHEHKGSHIPNKVHTEEFKNCSNQNNLIDFPTKGAFYTWHNGRHDNGLVERRLDIVLGNHHWMTINSVMNASSLPKLK